ADHDEPEPGLLMSGDRPAVEWGRVRPELLRKLLGLLRLLDPFLGQLLAVLADGTAEQHPTFLLSLEPVTILIDVSLVSGGQPFGLGQPLDLHAPWRQYVALDDLEESAIVHLLLTRLLKRVVIDLAKAFVFLGNVLEQFSALLVWVGRADR